MSCWHLAHQKSQSDCSSLHITRSALMPNIMNIAPTFLWILVWELQEYEFSSLCFGLHHHNSTISWYWFYTEYNCYVGLPHPKSSRKFSFGMCREFSLKTPRPNLHQAGYCTMKAVYKRQEPHQAGYSHMKAVWKWYTVCVNGPQQLSVHFSSAVRQ